MTDKIVTDAVLNSLANAKAAMETAEAEHAEITRRFIEYQKEYLTLRVPAGSDLLSRLVPLLRKFGPVIVKYVGGPGAAAAATAILADDGAFSGIGGFFAKLLAVIGG